MQGKRLANRVRVQASALEVHFRPVSSMSSGVKLNNWNLDATQPNLATPYMAFQDRIRNRSPFLPTKYPPSSGRTSASLPIRSLSTDISPLDRLSIGRHLPEVSQALLNSFHTIRRALFHFRIFPLGVTRQQPPI